MLTLFTFIRTQLGLDAPLDFVCPAASKGPTTTAPMTPSSTSPPSSETPFCPPAQHPLTTKGTGSIKGGKTMGGRCHSRSRGSSLAAAPKDNFNPGSGRRNGGKVRKLMAGESFVQALRTKVFKIIFSFIKGTGKLEGMLWGRA